MTETPKRADCPCKRAKCERHGDCAACRAHHAAKKNAPPACDRLRQKEARKRRG